jgi:hypothetical protein
VFDNVIEGVRVAVAPGVPVLLAVIDGVGVFVSV